MVPRAVYFLLLAGASVYAEDLEPHVMEDMDSKAPSAPIKIKMRDGRTKRNLEGGVIELDMDYSPGGLVGDLAGSCLSTFLIQCIDYIADSILSRLSKKRREKAMKEERKDDDPPYRPVDELEDKPLDIAGYDLHGDERLPPKKPKHLPKKKVVPSHPSPEKDLKEYVAPSPPKTGFEGKRKVAPPHPKDDKELKEHLLPSIPESKVEPPRKVSPPHPHAEESPEDGLVVVPLKHEKVPEEEKKEIFHCTRIDTKEKTDA
ncbi:F5 8 type C domain containing protein, putative [Babesia ovis]|uniref:F5 8 type C domain containing protein, putative n=1 Tax=Babesia ovis TaxID=5869 RepID=A0A9W5T970_BABOV|nr:F5 8 type C domain containing protein, putative [Babesia ovis]